MNWDCRQLAGHLDDYLEGRLAAAEQAAAEAHARTCSRCAAWEDARRATLWLRRLEPLETPPGLETRILAQTLAPPPQESFGSVLEAGWRALMQPRFALGLAAALVSAVLVLHTFDISLRNVRTADLNPVNLYRAVNRGVQQTYARGVRFVSDLRLVYEIRSRLEEMTAETDRPRKGAPSSNAPQSPPKTEKKPENSSGRERVHWLFASQTFGGLRELR